MNEELTRLIAVLEEVNDEIDFASETALVDDGLLDSLELMKLIVALSDASHVRINPGEVAPENFNSVQAMLALVKGCPPLP